MPSVCHNRWSWAKGYVFQRQVKYWFISIKKCWVEWFIFDLLQCSKDAVNHFHHTSVKIPNTEKPAKLRIISWESFMFNDIPAFPLLMTSLVNILKAQNPDVVFLYNVEPATLDRLKKSLPNFRFIYEFNDQMRYISSPFPAWVWIIF
jgi:hypothetical protein